jgi:hypothetical protein
MNPPPPAEGSGLEAALVGVLNTGVTDSAGKALLEEPVFVHEAPAFGPIAGAQGGSEWVDECDHIAQDFLLASGGT